MMHTRLGCCESQIGFEPEKFGKYGVQISEIFTSKCELFRTGLFLQIKELYASQAINEKTRCWCKGLEGWRVLHAIPQLR